MHNKQFVVAPFGRLDAAKTRRHTIEHYTSQEILMKVLIFVISVPLPQVVFAGGTSWLFTVSSFAQTSASEAIVVFEVSAEEKNIPHSCPSITVQVRYRPETWPFKTWSDETVTERTHRDALGYIKNAYISGEPIRFGSMGYGLKQVSHESRCRFRSRGFAMLRENDGSYAVYSFFDPI